LSREKSKRERYHRGAAHAYHVRICSVSLRQLRECTQCRNRSIIAECLYRNRDMHQLAAQPMCVNPSRHPVPHCIALFNNSSSRGFKTAHELTSVRSMRYGTEWYSRQNTVENTACQRIFSCLGSWPGVNLGQEGNDPAHRNCSLIPLYPRLHVIRSSPDQQLPPSHRSQLTAVTVSHR
jgi:hypothetical protein